MAFFKMLFLSIIAIFIPSLQLAIGAGIHRSSCRRDAIFKLTDRGKKLVLKSANILQKMSRVRLPICANKCTSTFDCRSFNYKNGKGTNCHILDIDKSNASVTLESVVGWNHYEPVETIGPRCRLVTCNAGYRCVESCAESVGYQCIDIDECKSSPCQNGATCNNLENKYTCTCVSGYTGVNCESDYDECTSTPCQNGGNCNNLFNGYTCTCAAGYTGTNCESDFDECWSTPCQNGGGCNNLQNSYSCSCASGYTGTNCQTVQVPGCGYYSTLSEADRAHSYVDGSAVCDSGLTTGWYRFSGSAGSTMRSSCVSGYGSTYRCKTHAGGWLNGAHPSIAEGEVSRTVCFAWSSSCCTWSQTIKVKNCGSYFLYYLSKPTGGCTLRYCGSA